MWYYKFISHDANKQANNKTSFRTNFLSLICDFDRGHNWRQVPFGTILHITPGMDGLKDVNKTKVMRFFLPNITANMKKISQVDEKPPVMGCTRDSNLWVSSLNYTTTEAERAVLGISSKQEYKEYHNGECQRVKIWKNTVGITSKLEPEDRHDGLRNYASFPCLYDEGHKLTEQGNSFPRQG